MSSVGSGRFSLCGAQNHSGCTCNIILAEKQGSERSIMSTDLPEGENTYVFDTESAAEMARLIDLDRMLTKEMGGSLAEQDHPERFRSILDLACGPGGWALDAAFTYPESEVAGVDVSRLMVDYANARALSQHLHNVSFGVMDIRQPLDFADQSFDLINARLLVGVLHREVWPSVLAECKRLLKPGGVLRLTESEGGFSSSPASEAIDVMIAQFLHRAGYGFSSTGRTYGMVPALARLLRNASFVDIQSKAHAIRFSPFDETYADICASSRVLLQQMRPILISMGMITEEELDKQRQQMEIEMLSDEFSGVMLLMTAWGIKSA